MSIYEIYVNYKTSDWKNDVVSINCWCKQNCNNFYYIDPLSLNMRILFTDETDVMAFKLAWL